MRKFILLLLGLTLCLIIAAQTSYTITSSSPLNVRNDASPTAEIIGTLPSGSQVDVYDIENGWARILYKDFYAYISANHIATTEPLTPLELEEIKVSEGWSLDFLTLGNNIDGRWLLIPIIALIIFMNFVRRSNNNFLHGAWYHTMWIMFLGVCILEIVYLSIMGWRAIWFCSPDTVGWLVTIISFCAFAWLLFMQIKNYFRTLDDIEYNTSGYYDRRIGFYSWLGTPIALIVMGMIYEPAVDYVLYAGILCQIIQIVLIFRAVVPRSGWWNAIMATAVYMLGGLATLLFVAHFLRLLIIAIVAFVLLMIFFAGSGNKKNR